MDAVSIRGDWVGKVIDGKFPLLEWLAGSGGNGIYLTVLTSSERAAIKLIPASAQAEDRLAVWSSAASLSHPHLLRILHYGRAEIDGTRFVYIVTDLAEEVLSQIIPERPLSAGEAREMLGPILDALGYLHDNGYVHGHLKPSNILVVGDRVKLSSDGLLPFDSVTPHNLADDIHTAPETAGNPVTPSADIWSLGITLVEALTQEPPIWDAAAKSDPVVPASVPQPFSAIARECLHPDPSRRCSLSDIHALLDGKPVAVSSPTPKPPAQTQQPPESKPPRADHDSLGEEPVSPRAVPASHSTAPQRKMPLVPLIVGFVLLVAIIIGLQMHNRRTQTAPQQTETTQQAPPAEPDATQPSNQPALQAQPGPAATSPAPAAASSGGDVLSRDVPDVPQSARNTIHGTVNVVVRVGVDASGAVGDADFASHGPSAYFARLALQSARNWKFRPPQQGGRSLASTWLLHYAFRRDGVVVRPEETSPK